MLTNNVVLKKHQDKMLFDKSRFVVACGARRTGKTTVHLLKLFQKACWEDDWKTPVYNRTVWYVTDSYGHAKNLIWNDLARFIPFQYIKNKLNGELTIELVNGSSISLKGSDNPDSLVGSTLHHLSIDEAALCKEDVFSLLLPTISSTGGSMFITSTPRGYDNWFYEKWNYYYEYLKGNSSYKDWSSHHFTTLEAGIVIKSEIELARHALDDKMFKQEYEASFESTSNTIYHAFVDKLVSQGGNLDNVNCVDDSEYPLYIGMDFNVNPMCSNVWIKKMDNLYCINEFVLPNSNTNEMIQAIKNTYPDRQIYICPDATGGRRDTRGNNSDHKLLKEAGFKIKVDLTSNLKPINPEVLNTIDEVNGKLCNSKGERTLFIHPKCNYTRNSLKRQTYKSGRVPDKSSGWDHMNDCTRYTVHQLFPFTKLIRSKVSVSNMSIL